MQVGNFKDSKVSRPLNEQGYVILDELLQQTVCDLEGFYNGLSSPHTKGFHPSMFWKDSVLKKEISHRICSALAPYVQQYLPGYRLLYGNFMVKEPGPESVMKIHQDWAYVDESKFDSYAIWFPLEDLNEQNGALWVIPGSHQFDNKVRGPGTYCPFEQEEEWLSKKYGKPLYLKAGQAVVWQHRLLHYSPPNLSKKVRVAVTAILVPEEATVFHFYKNDQSAEVEQYEVDSDFYMHYTIGSAPKQHATLYRKLPEAPFVCDRSHMKRLLKQSTFIDKWTRKIKLIFHETSFS